MDALRAWVTDLVVLVLVGSCLELALPHGRYRPYVRMVLGLLLLAAMLNPALGWLRGTSALPLLDDAEGTPTAGWSGTGGDDTSNGSDAADRLQAVQGQLVGQVVREQLAATAAAAALTVPGVTRATAAVQLARPPSPSTPAGVGQVQVTIALDEQAGALDEQAGGEGGHPTPGDSRPVAPVRPVTPVPPVAPVSPVAPVPPVVPGAMMHPEESVRPRRPGEDRIVRAVQAAVAGRLLIDIERVTVAVARPPHPGEAGARGSGTRG